MISLRELLNGYQNKKCALPAFNIDSFEIYQAVEAAVAEINLPCIVQLSANEDTFIRAERLMMLVKKANAEGLPIYLNMDHGTDISRLETCLRLGFDMVHFDASKMDYPLSLTVTQSFVEKIKKSFPQSLIEVEFNHISTSLDQDSFTSPTQAKEFMDTTKADLFAPSIGSFHGANISAPEQLNISLLSQIKEILPNTFLTLHGGSGVPLDQIQSAINLGVVKININTDLRHCFIESLRHQLTIQNSEKIYDYLAPTINDLKEIIKEKLISFSQNV